MNKETQGDFKFDLDALRAEMLGTPEATREFLLVSLQSGVLDTIPDRATEESWLKSFDIVYGAYVGAETHEEIAERHGLEVSGVDEIVRTTLKTIWEMSPDSIQNKYPLEDIAKPRLLTGISALKLYSQVSTLVEQGISESEIYTILGLSREAYWERRKEYYNNFNLLLPTFSGKETKYENQERLKRYLDANTQDEREQILEGASYQFFEINSRGEESLFVKLPELGLTRKKLNKDIFERMRAASIEIYFVERPIERQGKKYIRTVYYIPIQSVQAVKEFLTNLD